MTLCIWGAISSWTFSIKIPVLWFLYDVKICHKFVGSQMYIRCDKSCK